ncbi:MAG: hypothetical protein ABI647_10005 [Gemmatimonadota bacterium]
MTKLRCAGAVAAGFVVSQILAIAVHGYILAADYAPFYRTLLRPMTGEASGATLMLPLSHLCFVAALVWLFTRVRLAGSPMVRRIKLGLVGWIIGQVPAWLIWYAEQPWPGTLVVKLLAFELISAHRAHDDWCDRKSEAGNRKSGRRVGVKHRRSRWPLGFPIPIPYFPCPISDCRLPICNVSSRDDQLLRSLSRVSPAP